MEFFQCCLFDELRDKSRKIWDDLTVKSRVLSEMLDGLSYIHKKGIIHNRINPKSVYIKYMPTDSIKSHPTPLIADFASAMVPKSMTDSNIMNSGNFVAMQMSVQ